MRYPMSMRLGRQMEEMGEVVECWGRRAGCVVAKEELVLERLPFVARIEGGKGGEVERLVTFKGVGGAGDEQSDDDDLAAEAARDRAKMPPPAAPGGGLGVGGGKGLLEEGVEKLWLSEDDIEDC